MRRLIVVVLGVSAGCFNNSLPNRPTSLSDMEAIDALVDSEVADDASLDAQPHDLALRDACVPYDPSLPCGGCCFPDGAPR